MRLCCFLLSYHVFGEKAISALAVTVQFSTFPLPFSRAVLIMIYSGIVLSPLVLQNMLEHLKKLDEPDIRAIE